MKTLRVETIRHETLADRVRCVQAVAENYQAYRLYTLADTDERLTSIDVFLGAGTAAELKALDNQAHLDFDPPDD